MERMTVRVFKQFRAKDGRRVILREPHWEDLDDLLEFINSLVEEGADICRETVVTRKEEADWLGKRLAAVEKSEVIHIAAEVDGKVVANSEAARRGGLMNHVGILGIAIKNGYRGIGLGSELMNALIEESQKAGLKVLVLEVFGTNSIAKQLYEKYGFKESGRIPKGILKKGTYIDSIRMTLEL